MDLNNKLDVIDQKLDSIQIKVAYQEDTIETLNQTIISQQEMISTLQLRLDKMIEKVKSIPDSDIAGADNIELPPHY